MSALTKNKPTFMLYSREKSSTVKARPFKGNHDEIIMASLERMSSKHKSNIIELSKI